MSPGLPSVSQPHKIPSGKKHGTPNLAHPAPAQADTLLGYEGRNQKNPTPVCGRLPMLPLKNLIFTRLSNQVRPRLDPNLYLYTKVFLFNSSIGTLFLNPKKGYLLVLPSSERWGL